MSDQGFGQYAGGGGSSVAIDGAFTATIKNIEVLTTEKPRAKITVMIDDNSEFSGETLTRTGGISFGMNSESKKWSWLAQFIQAAAGIPCGDPAQKKSPLSGMIGKRVRIKVMHDDEKGYNNIIAFGAIQASNQNAVRPQAVHDTAPVVPNTAPVTMDRLLPGLSESDQRKIIALAQAKKIGVGRLRLLIAGITGSVSELLTPRDVAKLVDTMRADEVPA